MSARWFAVVLIAAVLSFLPAQVFAAEWYATRAATLLGVPSAPSGELIKTLADLSKAKTPITDQQVDALTATVMRGVDPNTFTAAVAEIPLGARGRIYEGRLGSGNGRNQVYAAMWGRADHLAGTSPEQAQRTLRAVTLLSILDSANAPVQLSLEKLGDPKQAPAKLGIEGEGAAELATLLEDVRSRVALPKGFSDYVASLAPVYELNNGRLPADRLEHCLDAAEQMWSATINLGTRFGIASELWRIKCLAKAVHDDKAMHAIRATAEKLSAGSEDPASLKWSKQIMELDGPTPKQPGIKVLHPSDLKPKVPR